MASVETNEGLKVIRLNVSGMTCSHCEAAVRRALEAVPGVSAVGTVDRAKEVAEVEGNPDIGALIAAIRAEGYKASAIQAGSS